MKKIIFLFGTVLFCASVMAQPKFSTPKTFDGGVEFDVITTSTNSGESNGKAEVDIIAGIATSYSWYTSEDVEIPDSEDLIEIEGLATGEYYVVVANAASCSTRKDFTISVEDIDLPILELTSIDDEVCFGEEIEITATSDDAISYKWFNGGDEIPDETSNTLTISNLPIGVNNITAKVEVDAGWSEVSAPIEITVLGYPTFEITDDNVSGIICGNDVVTYTITVTGGTPNYTVSLVQWFDEDGDVEINVKDQDGDDIELNEGQYNVTVSEYGGTATFGVSLKNPLAAGEQVKDFRTGYIVVDDKGCYER